MSSRRFEIFFSFYFLELWSVEVKNWSKKEYVSNIGEDIVEQALKGSCKPLLFYNLAHPQIHINPLLVILTLLNAFLHRPDFSAPSPFCFFIPRTSRIGYIFSNKKTNDPEEEITFLGSKNGSWLGWQNKPRVFKGPTLLGWGRKEKDHLTFWSIIYYYS